MWVLLWDRREAISWEWMICLVWSKAGINAWMHGFQEMLTPRAPSRYNEILEGVSSSFLPEWKCPKYNSRTTTPANLTQDFMTWTPPPNNSSSITGFCQLQSHPHYILRLYSSAIVCPSSHLQSASGPFLRLNLKITSSIPSLFSCLLPFFEDHAINSACMLTQIFPPFRCPTAQKLSSCFFTWIAGATPGSSMIDGHHAIAGCQV